MYKRQDFYFDLPKERIAQAPLAVRSHSRLLAVDKTTGQLSHHPFIEIAAYVQPGDLIVFNDTRVIHARLYGHKTTGGQVEILIERIVTPHRALAHIRANHAPKPDGVIELDAGYQCCVLGKQNNLYEIETLAQQDWSTILTQVGAVPLPPYITRQATHQDQERYQTVYAKNAGAVAAPTAGLHFDEALLSRLAENDIGFDFVTLHVGAGTFQPVRTDDIRLHQMHQEWISVSATLCERIKAVKALGKKVWAVGTTVVRCLETAALAGELKSYEGDTNIFIYPGFEFKVIDGLLTNFHLPESTLLMLVSAFASMSVIKNAYQVAIEKEYRFFSYGDAMLIY